MLRRFLLGSLLLLSSLHALDQPTFGQNERHFNFHYAFTVKNVSPGEPVRVWIPLAHSDAFQEMKLISKSGDLPLKLVHQQQYGNEVLYADVSKAGQVTGSEQTFTRLRQHRLLLLAGYAVIDQASFPAVGDPKKAYDTYLEQLLLDAKAAVDKAVSLGVADPGRINANSGGDQLQRRTDHLSGRDID